MSRCVLILSLVGSLGLCADQSRAQTCNNCTLMCNSSIITIQNWFQQSGCTSPCVPPARLHKNAKLILLVEIPES